MPRNTVWSALTSNRMLINSFLPAIVSIVIYIALRYSPIDVEPSNEVTNNIMLIHTTRNSSNDRHNHVQSQKSHYNGLTTNKFVRYDNKYLTPEAHASLWWLNRTMNTSSFKEWYNVTNDNVQLSSLLDGNNNNSNGSDNKKVYANEVLSIFHVWYLYMAGNYMKACEYLCNALEMNYINNALIITGIQYILLPHRLYFQLSPLYLIVMFSIMYYVAKRIVQQIAVLLLCALERRAMATINDKDVKKNNFDEENENKNDKSDTCEEANKTLHSRTINQFTEMGLAQYRVIALQRAITLMGTITLSIGLFVFSIILEVTTFHPVCISTIMLLGVINAVLQEEIVSSAIAEKDKESIYTNTEYITQNNHAIRELYEAQHPNYTETFCTERPIVMQRYLYYCLPRSLPSLKPLSVASLLMATLCLTESYYLYLLPLFVLWCMTSCYRRAFCRVLVCVKPPEGITSNEANEFGYVEIGLSSYHDKWYMLRGVGNALAPAVLCVVMLLVMHEPTNNVHNVFKMIELFGKPPFPTLHAVHLTRKEQINNNNNNNAFRMYSHVNDHHNKYKLNNATNTFYDIDEMDENNTLVRMMRSLNSSMEYANQWELELSLTGGKELLLQQHLHSELNTACALANNNSYYNYNSRPTANLWALTEYMGLPWSEMVMHVALMLTSINNNLPNASSSFYLSSSSSSESMSSGLLSIAEADYITRAVVDAQLMLDYFSLVLMVLVNVISLITLAFYRLRRPPPFFDNPKVFLQAQASYHAEAIHLQHHQKQQQHKKQQGKAKAKKNSNNEEENDEQTATIDCSVNCDNTSAENKGKSKVISENDSSAAYKDVTKTCVCAHEYLLKHTIMFLLMSILIGTSSSLFLIHTSVMSITCTWPFVMVLFAMLSMNTYLRTEVHHLYTRPATNLVTNNVISSEQQEHKQSTEKSKSKAETVRLYKREDDDVNKFFVEPYAHISSLEETNNAYVQTSTWCVSSPLSLFEFYDEICINIMFAAVMLSLTGSFVSTCVAMTICFIVVKLFQLFVHWQSEHSARQTKRAGAQWSTRILWWLFIVLTVFCITCTVALVISHYHILPLVQEICLTAVNKLELVVQNIAPHISDLLCLNNYYHHHYENNNVVFASRIATRFVAAALFCAAMALIWLRLIHLNLQPGEVRLSTSNN